MAVGRTKVELPSVTLVDDQVGIPVGDLTLRDQSLELSRQPSGQREGIHSVARTSGAALGAAMAPAARVMSVRKVVENFIA